jgi:5-methyltetrahydrofolate--homocysteine methyltransferase
MNRFLRLLDERPFLLADGATGTNLFQAGLQTGDAPELWNTDHPERIATLHQSFVDAGADIILTNTFGGTRHRLKLHQAESRVHELNLAGAQIARRVADMAQREIVVGGSMGPTGELFQPLGPLTHDEGRAAFAEQAAGLAEGGVDALWIETMSSREELDAALEGAASVDLPVVCTCSFDTNGRTMMGITPADLARICAESMAHPCAFGSNCGVGASELVAAILNLSDAAGPDAVLVAKANCGIPEWVDGAIRYNGTPDLMADYARLAFDSGARIIGGCCGTSPAHLRAMRDALDRHVKGARPSLSTVVERLGTVSTGAQAQARGEMDVTSGAVVDADRSPRRRRRRDR